MDAPIARPTLDGRDLVAADVGLELLRLIPIDSAIEQLLEPVSCARPREPLGEQAATPPHLLGKLAIRKQAPDTIGVRRWIVAVDEVAAHLVAHDRAQPRNARRDHRSATRLRLESDEPEGFAVRRHDAS